jgi:tripartite-type tricarboxylate transporter receptor subunit TctC
VKKLALLLLGALLLGAQTTYGSDASFAGREITLTAGFNTGGAYDLYARIFARRFSEHLPGSPTVIVKNMPGAGSLIAADYLYNEAARDGTEIGLLAGTAAFEPLFKINPTHFDARKFQWLGSANKEVGACFVRANSSVKTAQDLMRAPVVIGTAGTSSLLIPTVLNKVLGAKLRIVRGYNGTSDLMLALNRGEVEGMCGMVWAAVEADHPDWLKNGLVRTVMQIGLEPSAQLPAVPLITDFAHSKQEQDLLRLLIGWSVMGRPFVAPPGVPKARIQALRDAFEATMKDPGFRSDMARARLDVDPMSAQQIMQLLNQAYAAPPQLVQEADQFLLEAR